MIHIIDHLLFRAKMEPRAVAIQRTDYQLTYAQLVVLVKKVAGLFRRQSIQPGHIVITNIADKMLDWVITLALMHESAITCSNNLYRPIVPVIPYDWIITDKQVAEFETEKTILVDGAWLSSLQDSPVEVHPQRIWNNQRRLVMTSGTTGTSKVVQLSMETAIARAKNSLEYMLPCEKFFSLFGLSSGLGFNNAIIRLLRGLPLYCAHSGENVVELINKFAIEGMHGSVVQIAAILKVAQKIGQIPSSVKAVIYAGGAASPVFLDNVSRLLTKNIYNDYGATETAGLCVCKPGVQTTPSFAGYPYPDVNVEVVDAADTPLPIGEEGVLRFQRPHMVNGYYNNHVASAASFKDGWFYSGDRGRLTPEGMLHLTGRESELINRGGIKIDPVAIDQYLSGCSGVEDGAAFGWMNAMGVQDLAVALVVNGAFNFQSFKQELLEAFGQAKFPTYFLQVAQIPRNQAGKILRHQLSEHAGRLVTDSQSFS